MPNPLATGHAAVARHSGSASAASAPAPGRVRWACAGITVVVVAVFAVVLRGCQYDLTIPARYAAYFGFEILVPGTVLLYLVRLRPLSPSRILALAVPTGFAIEIFSFLGLSAWHATMLMPWLPLAWLASAAVRYARYRDIRWQRPAPAQIVTAAALALIGFATVVAAASQMYAESPLVDGLPQRPIFHDWVYLLSRAAVLKHAGPLQDPSLAGTPLQYHYYFLVHVAAASATTSIAVSWIFLRLAVIPLGFVMTAQAYALGKLLTRSRAVGVLAALLFIVPGELSFTGSYAHLAFLGHFIRWLYVSPTFFFGLTFFGALLLAVPAVGTRWPHLLWIALLAAAGTGAKGSVLPVVLGALLVFWIWSAVTERRVPSAFVAAGCAMAVAFLITYAVTMAQVGSGGAIFEPFKICRLTPFWDAYAIPVQRYLKRTLHAPDFGTWLGASVIAGGVLAGTAGVRIVALPYFIARHARNRVRIGRWLATATLSSVAFGLMLHFDGDSELYFFLPERLPLAVLSAACLFSAYAYVRRSWGQPVGRPALRHIAALGTLGAAALALGIQSVNAASCQLRGLADWFAFDPSTRINTDLLPLYETAAWLRDHTEENAVVMSNAFTLRHLNGKRGDEIDHTTAGVYYYYSALAERRMWVEGPTYLSDQPEALHRLCCASKTFYLGEPPPGALAQAGPPYIVIDRSLGDGARFTYEPAARVFKNDRFEVYRLGLDSRGVARADRSRR